jgi:hypothetical protein
LTKIAIFGDSFAADPHKETSKIAESFIKEVYAICNRVYSKKEVFFLKKKWGEMYKGWPRYLEADVYSCSGSDLYFSYNQFITHHSKYEKCIFIITGPLRYSTKISDWLHCASIEDAIEGIELAGDDSTKKYYSTLANFLENIYYRDLDRIEIINQALIDNIKFQRPDTLFINAFPDLVQIYNLELAAWDTTHEESQDYTRYFDLRHCHMTNDNNKILADFIKNNLDTNGYLDLSSIKWKHPTLDEKNQYLVETKNLFTWLL